MRTKKRLEVIEEEVKKLSYQYNELKQEICKHEFSIYDSGYFPLFNLNGTPHYYKKCEKCGYKHIFTSKEEWEKEKEEYELLKAKNFLEDNGFTVEHNIVKGSRSHRAKKRQQQDGK